LDRGEGRCRGEEHAVTIALEPPRQWEGGEPEGFPARPAGPGGRPGRLRGWFARHPAWPITAVLAGFPVWWALGVGDYIFVALSIPMVGRMYGWARSGRRLRVPPGFGLWLLFLLVTLASVATLSLTAPGTIASPISSRAIAFTIRLAQYCGVTVLLLYAGNLTEEELPRRRLAWLLGLVALYTTAGGVGGVLAPSFQLTSPLTAIIPHSLDSSSLAQSIKHPALAQIQNVLGAPSGRPEAPFTYTDIWGSAVVLLFPWLLVGWWWGGSRRQRLVAATALILVPLPFLYSLDRGAWIGACVAVLYLALRLAARGKLALLAGLLTGVAVLSLAIAATPAQDLFTGRLHSGNSNNIRASQSVIALEDARASPFLGYGSTRHMRGSPSSITIGPSAACPGCGQYEIGSNGQLGLLLVCTGFLGAALYLGFFGYGIWRYRRDTTPYGLAGVLVLLLTFVFMLFYNAVGAPLAFTMLSFALLWRNDRQAQSVGTGAGANGSRNGRRTAARALA